MVKQKKVSKYYENDCRSVKSRHKQDKQEDMYEYWYHYVKPKYGKIAKLCCMDIDSSTVHLKLGVIYAGVAGDVKRRFDTSNYEVKRPLPIRKNNNKKKTIRLMKNKLDGKITKEFSALRPKMCSYLTDDDDDDGCIGKKAKGTKKYVIN